MKLQVGRRRDRIFFGLLKILLLSLPVKEKKAKELSKTLVSNV
jgi:hypothetical protein